MGSIEEWNAIKTSRAAEELVAHARAGELRRQGLIGPTDGVAEARAHDQRVREANMSTGAKLLPGLLILAGGILFMVLVISFWISSIS